MKSNASLPQRNPAMKAFATALMILAGLAGIVCLTPEFFPKEWLGSFKFIWLLPAITLIFAAPRTFIDRRLLPVVLFPVFMGTYAFMLQAVSGRCFLGMDIYNFAVCAFLTVIGFAYTRFVGERDYRRFASQLAFCLTLLSVILALTITFRHLSHPDFTLYNSGYEFKNATAFAFTLVLAFVYSVWSQQRRALKIFYVVSFIILTVAIALLRSRASYLCLAGLICYMWAAIPHRKIKYEILAAGVILIGILLALRPTREFFLMNLIMGSRTLDNPDLFTSFRLSQMGEVTANMQGVSWIFGQGCIYLDCFPVKILLEYGALGFCAVAAFLVWTGRQVFRAFRFRRSGTALFILFWLCLLNSLLEAYPPFGPGLRCFLLWLTLGHTLAITSKSHRLIQNRTNEPI